MKKSLSLFLLLTIATPAIPMQRAMQLINKYGMATMQIGAGAAALSLAAYGALKYGKVPPFSEAIVNYIKSGLSKKSLVSASVVKSNGAEFTITSSKVPDFMLNVASNNNQNQLFITRTNDSQFPFMFTNASGAMTIRLANNSGENYFDGQAIKVVDNNIFVNGKQIDVDQPSQDVHFEKQLNDSFVANPITIGASAILGTLLLSEGISNFKKAYRQ